MTGAEIVVESLKREGVKHIFGYPGGVILNIFDLLYDDKDLKLILTRHEQGAVHAADGYARSTGKPGVVLVTSGPGATNTVTGLATASMDSIPLVVLTGQVPTALIGNDAFQEADIVGISRPCTKYNLLSKDVKELAQQIREAFYIASTGRPGPVLIDLPKDVTSGKADFVWPEQVSLHTRLYYGAELGGVNFHQSGRPCYADFAYLSFTVGATFQVTDTDLCSAEMRRTVLRHALLSYLFGAVIIAATVNLLAGLAR